MGESTKKKWENPEIAEKMLLGLRKGTETVKQKASENYIEHECPICHKTFRTKNWNSHKYCSLECANQDLKHTLKEKSELGVQVIKEKYSKTQQERFSLILNWLKIKENADIVYNAKLNDLKYLNNLAEYVGIKDPRSLAKVLEVKNKKDTHNKLKEILIKMYAVPSDE